MRPRVLAAVVVAAFACAVPQAVPIQRFDPGPDVPNVAVTLRVPTPGGFGGPRSEAEPPREARQPPDQKGARGSAQKLDTKPVIGLKPRLVREWHVLSARGESAEPQSSEAPCPRASTCDTHQLKRAKWPTDSSGSAIIPFAYNDEARRRARAPDGITQPALKAAMSEWSHWNSNIVFRDTGTTTATFAADGKDGSCDDGTNVITWGRFEPEVIGAAVLCFDESGRVIRDADLALNAAQHWERVSGTPESRHSHDIQSILTHELGHWLGFEDIYSGDAVRQTMYGNTAYGQTNKRTLALGDIVGIQKAYPCSDGDRCPRSGIKDD
ncbi:MAG TPA: matrixin family metalloprotease [Actinomycetota bacterium]|jgi:hypothetical protein|nr:matrixin family metalloprotease [Actinomycetota bacterium]